MEFPKKLRALFLLILTTIVSVQTTFAKNQIVYFNDINTPSDTVGSLSGTVKFAQSIIIPAVSRYVNDTHPKLTGMRDTLVMFKPKKKISDSTPLYLFVKDQNEKILALRKMNNPSQIPLHVNHEFFVDEEKYDYIIDTQEELDKISFDRGDGNWGSTSYFNKIVTDNKVTLVKITDDNYIANFTLPRSKNAHLSKIVIVHQAKKPSTIHLGGGWFKPFEMNREIGKMVANNYGGTYHVADETFVNIRYGEFWHTVVPARFIEQGISFHFATSKNTSAFKNVQMVGESQLLINNIAIGMLTEPRESYNFTSDSELSRQYYQMIPATRLIVSESQPIHLKEVMMPWGDLYKTASPDTGGIHDGDMRNKIGKQLISKAINLANYGLNSSDPMDNLYYANQITAHTSIGVYANGKQVHGASGGGSMVTLANTFGNEWSHELGHNYGAGHNPGGVWGQKHRGANQVNSGWGWDQDKNLFITNFTLRHPMTTNCALNECNAPFMGRLAYNKDAMVGGQPVHMSGNHFTLHTPFLHRKIQTTLSTKYSFNPFSSTGYTQWNAETNREEEAKPLIPVPMKHFEASHIELAGNKLANAFAKYDFIKVSVDLLGGPTSKMTKTTENTAAIKNPIRIAIPEKNKESVMKGATVPTIYLSLPAATEKNKFKSMELLENSSFKIVISRPGQTNFTINPTDRGRYRYLYSTGEKWEHKWQISEVLKHLKPIYQGAKTTTIFGYYDPEEELPSYIYSQPIYSSYGMIYSHENYKLSQENRSCRLKVTLKNGAVQQHSLHNRRLRGPSQGREKYMNKFHVNFPQSNPPIRAAIFCNGKMLAQRVIDQRDKTFKPALFSQGISALEQQTNYQRRRNRMNSGR